MSLRKPNKPRTIDKAMSDLRLRMNQQAPSGAVSEEIARRKEHNIRLYRERQQQGLDIFTGLAHDWVERKN
jgi:hypothetical protein